MSCTQKDKDDGILLQAIIVGANSNIEDMPMVY